MVDTISTYEALALLGHGFVIGAIAAAAGVLGGLLAVGGLAVTLGALSRAFDRRDERRRS